MVGRGVVGYVGCKYHLSYVNMWEVFSSLCTLYTGRWPPEISNSISCGLFLDVRDILVDLGASSAC